MCDDICEVHAGGFLMLLEVSWCWCLLKGLWSPLECLLATHLSIHFAPAWIISLKFHHIFKL